MAATATKAKQRRQVSVDLPDWAVGLLDRPERYLVVYGGRGGGKSWGIAINLVLRCATRPGFTVAVVREFAITLNDGAIALLWAMCQRLGLPARKAPTTSAIRFQNGSRIFAIGSERNPENLRGLESADVAWVEEAATISRVSIELLDPSLRRPGAKLVASFNPRYADDAVYEMFVLNKPSNAWVHRVTYGEYPEFTTPELDAPRQRMLEAGDPLYAHVWLGELRPMAGQVFDASQIAAAPDTPDAPSVRAWDTAGTEGGGDWTVGVLMRRRDDAHYHIADVVRGQWHPAGVERQILHAAQRDGAGTRIHIEQGAGDAGKTAAMHMSRALDGYPVRFDRATGSKAERARPFASAVNSGRVSRLPDTGWWSTLSAELAAFSEDTAEMRGRHDDQVDACSLAYNALAGRRQPEKVWVIR